MLIDETTIPVHEGRHLRWVPGPAERDDVRAELARRRPDLTVATIEYMTSAEFCQNHRARDRAHWIDRAANDWGNRVEVRITAPWSAAGLDCGLSRVSVIALICGDQVDGRTISSREEPREGGIWGYYYADVPDRLLIDAEVARLVDTWGGVVVDRLS